MLEIQFISISEDDWENWPQSRSLKLLASDALATERRILKGNKVSMERLRYCQLCEHIESLACKRLARSPTKLLVIKDRKSVYTYLSAQAQLANKTSTWKPPSGNLNKKKVGLMERLWEEVIKLFKPEMKETENFSILEYNRKQPVAKSFYSPKEVRQFLAPFNQWLNSEGEIFLGIDREDSNLLSAFEAIEGFTKEASLTGSAIVITLRPII